VAVRVPLIQLFTETVYTPLTTAQVSGRLQGNNIWSLSSTFPFQQLRYSNSVGNSATANFGSVTSLSALNAQYASYTCAATPATVTSTLSTLVNFYFRGKSGTCVPYDDGCDWAALAFSTSSSSVCSASDSWDTTQPWWIMSGTDNTYDPMIQPNYGSGYSAGSAGCHWSLGCNGQQSTTWVWMR